MLIGICGFQGAGKDTFANLLVEQFSFSKFSFASATKDILSTIFGWERHLLEGDTTESRVFRETIDLWWSEKLNIPDLTPRKMLQTIGTNLFREHFNENIWIRVVEKKILSELKKNSTGNIIISDCRFPNEIQMVRDLGGIIVYIERNKPLWFDDYKNGLNVDIPQIKLLHPSETSWIREKFDHVINNNSNNIDQYKQEIINFIKKITIV